MLSVPPVQVPLALANAPLSNSRGAGVCQASRHRWGSLRGMLHGWQSAFLPQRAACVLSTQSHATARRSDAVKNASRCDCQRMPLQSPTQAAAIANACRCDCQRKPLRLPTHAAAIANASVCVVHFLFLGKGQGSLKNERRKETRGSPTAVACACA